MSTPAPGPEGLRIGLEVHVYLATEAKMFCPCPNRAWDPAAEPNTLLCEVCTAQPGAKPRAPNAAALEQGLRLALTLGCDLRGEPLRFLRKHYFYPDLPANYQRTARPFATGGSIAGVPLRGIHWEEDPGAYDPKTGLVDFNRSGAPLVEVVTEPEVGSPSQAKEVLEELRLALDHLGAGSPAGTKADANISLRGGERVEVKNLNSARNVQAALEHEAERQAALLRSGGKVARETRHFDETFARTEPLRSKESEADYRFLPDPDLPAVDLAAPLARAKASLGPNPFSLRAAWMRDLGVGKEACNVLLGERGMAAAFAAVAQRAPPKAAFEFFVGDLKRELNHRSLRFLLAGLGTEEVAALVGGVASGALPRLRMVALLRTRLDQGPEAFAAALEAERGSAAGEDTIAQAVEAAIAAQPKAVEDYRRGRPEAANRILGDALKRLEGRASPQTVRAKVLAALDAPRGA
jgi:aspartyl-tRNA(Asn)/glutamyl-tRNA(Gln) amidotransferase subunit B